MKIKFLEDVMPKVVEAVIYAYSDLLHDCLYSNPNDPDRKSEEIKEMVDAAVKAYMDYVDANTKPIEKENNDGTN